MKTIILAAGRGSRLGEKTKDRPKCMCTLGGKTLLERCLETLSEAQISPEDTGIVTGYRSDMFTIPNVQYFHNAKWEQTNMFCSLMEADQWLRQEPCLVCYSDIVFSSKALKVLMDSKTPLALTYYTGFWELWSSRMDNPLDDLETFRFNDAGELTEIGKRPKSREEVQGQYMGLIRFTPESWGWAMEVAKEMPEKDLAKLDMTTLLEKLLEKGHSIQTLPVDDLWLECDTQADIEAYEREGLI